MASESGEANPLLSDLREHVDRRSIGLFFRLFLFIFIMMGTARSRFLKLNLTYQGDDDNRRTSLNLLLQRQRSTYQAEADILFEHGNGNISFYGGFYARSPWWKSATGGGARSIWNPQQQEEVPSAGRGDAEDEPTGSSSSSSASPTSNSENGRKKGEGEMQNKQERVTPPLVWIDLEMTGLDVEADRILEIACIITDGEVTKSIEGPDLVIHQSKERLDGMKEWCTKTHGASDLTERVIRSRVTERDAELQVDLLELVMAFVKRHVRTGINKPQLAGNSVYTDLIFLRKHMPELASIFSCEFE